jgi:hypothetical protein
VCLDNRWDFSLLNTFSCHRYSSGIFFVFKGWGTLAWNMTRPIKYFVSGLVQGTFFIHDVNIAFCASEARKMIGSWV